MNTLLPVVLYVAVLDLDAYEVALAFTSLACIIHCESKNNRLDFSL